MRSRRPSARTRILDVADQLFSERGIRAVGVEAIVAAADTAKTTLYSHFGSKDALVVAYLERRAARERERLAHAVATYPGSATERLLHLYDLLADELGEPGFRGSPFINACVELGHDHPAAATAHAHRHWLLATIAELAEACGAPEPADLAAPLLQLYEAAMVAAPSGRGAAHTAKSAAAALLSARLPAPGSPEVGTTAGRRTEGSPAAHRLVAFLNSAHLPDGDDHLSDDRAGPWLAHWLAEAGTTPPEALAAIAAAPAELRILREGLRRLAVVNCGGRADPAAVTEAAAVLETAPLLLDLAGGKTPRLIGVDGSGVTQLAVAVIAHAYLTVRAGAEWPRLKVCASPECHWAFFDTTRNRSRRWCDMAGCGNRAKNRTWRERHEAVTVKMV
jgi:predicted RNA-binding Zn ribbon-like protein